MSQYPSSQILSIDLSSFDQRRDEIVQAIMKAAKTHGVFYVKNHGIPIETLREMFLVSKQFFALSDSTKKNYSLDVPRNAGWERFAQIRPQTGLADLKESMQLAFHHIPDLWPDDKDVPHFQDKVQQFMEDCNQVSQRLLECLAIGLGFPQDFFTRCHDVSQPDALNTLRFQHYYDLTGSSHGSEYYRAGPHTDPDTLTLLFHEEHDQTSGLETCQGRTDVTTFEQGSLWLPVTPQPGELVCNIGDMMMRWSDDVLKSNFHRVNLPKHDLSSRYSICYFTQANKSAFIQGRTKYTDGLTAGDYLRQQMERNHQRLKKLFDQREQQRKGRPQQKHTPFQPSSQPYNNNNVPEPVLAI
ncbi:leucoanthocyanidin dioxygenase [Hesseltinella vesiculosa]|uniref:Leucoanthocyanidin dioxygenase n=1 Tax=Hesseltinella vesiculosa TaxID=101127 RepID=A0A1X2G582_9FUNG|nr:leucoanthocyanidin dioxygenase [Hesseltinella vesiculosa]